MKSDILRKKFLEYFKSRKHKIVDSDSLVPADDPTVLFTPAGMNQFKKEFMGHNSGFVRAATAQRCLRTDDLDKVGKTCGHHTFFEMLGNFSFGDYFKEEAIIYAWDFLTKELCIDKDSLWVSVYKDDDQAYGIWRNKIKLPTDKIVKLGDKENFWPSEARSKGPNGPCGPCSEIFFDYGKNLGCGKVSCSPACGCGRFVEVWNLVFTQFNRKEGGKLTPLPKKNIDTGMGLERLAAVMQGVRNNFQTDLFLPLVNEIKHACLQNPANYQDIYAVSDHIRAIVFSIYDGVLPSNEKRGYVARKIIRAAILHLRNLRIKEPFLYKLVPVLAKIMQGPYPELNIRRENISEIILTEENNFISILKSSDSIIEEETGAIIKMAQNDPMDNGVIMASSNTSAATGVSVFRLYDTHGIPPEQTLNWLKNRISIRFVDTDLYRALDDSLRDQRKRSQLQSEMKGDVFSGGAESLNLKATVFSGYSSYSCKAKVLAIIKGDKAQKAANQGDDVQIVLERTVFYPESGGQVGDRGELKKGRNIFEVVDTQKIGKVILHRGRVKSGRFKKGDFVSAEIFIARRISVTRNHTATHLLQAALRKILGAHVKQQGSLVAEERLRFDFTHFKDISRQQLKRIEELVNSYILAAPQVTKKQLTLKEAKEKGALAFFGEKYESKVRMVGIGGISLELCAGTHLDSVSQIGIFKIIQECSIASGVRRIEATTGSFAYKIVSEENDIIMDIAAALNSPMERLTQDLEKRLERIKELEKQLANSKMDSARDNLDSIMNTARVINGIRVITGELQDSGMDILRKSVDMLKQKSQNSVILLGSVNAGRALLVLGVTAELCQKGLDAQGLINEVSAMVDGSGGGRRDFAQAGGSKPENLKKAFSRLEELIKTV